MAVADKPELFIKRARQVLAGPRRPGRKLLQNAGLGPFKRFVLVEKSVPGIGVRKEIEQALHVLRRPRRRYAPPGFRPHVQRQVRQGQFLIVPRKTQAVHVFAHRLVYGRVERGPNPGRCRRRARHHRPDRLLGRVPCQSQVSAGANDHPPAFRPGAVFFENNRFARGGADRLRLLCRHHPAHHLTGVRGIELSKEDQILVFHRIGHRRTVHHHPFQAQVFQQHRKIPAKVRIRPVCQDNRIIRPQLTSRLCIAPLRPAITGQAERPNHQCDHPYQKLGTLAPFSPH